MKHKRIHVITVHFLKSLIEYLGSSFYCFCGFFICDVAAVNIKVSVALVDRLEAIVDTHDSKVVVVVVVVVVGKIAVWGSSFSAICSR